MGVGMGVGCRQRVKKIQGAADKNNRDMEAWRPDNLEQQRWNKTRGEASNNEKRDTVL